MSEEDYVDTIKKEIARNKLMTQLIAQIPYRFSKISDYIVEALTQQRKVIYKIIKIDNQEIGTPTDNELNILYEDGDFFEEEKRSFEVIIISKNKLFAKDIDVCAAIEDSLYADPFFENIPEKLKSSIKILKIDEKNFDEASDMLEDIEKKDRIIILKSAFKKKINSELIFEKCASEKGGSGAEFVVKINKIYSKKKKTFESVKNELIKKWNNNRKIYIAKNVAENEKLEANFIKATFSFNEKEIGFITKEVIKTIFQAPIENVISVQANNGFVVFKVCEIINNNSARKNENFLGNINKSIKKQMESEIRHAILMTIFEKNKARYRIDQKILEMVIASV